MKPKTGKKPTIPIADMSVDDFLDNMDFDADSDDNEAEEIIKKAKKKPTKKPKVGKKSKSFFDVDLGAAEEEEEYATVSNAKPSKKLKSGKITESKAVSESSQDDEELNLPPVKPKSKKVKKSKSPKVAGDSSQDEDAFELPPKMKAKLDKVLKKAEKRNKQFEVTSDTDEAPAQESVKPKKEKKKKGDKKKVTADPENGVGEKAAKVKKKKAKPVKEEQQESDASGDDTHDHNAALDNMKETDPEFYKFLENNDRKLLKFSVDEKSDGEDDSSEEDEVKNEKVHKPDADLQVASDESDFEAEDDAGEEVAGDEDDDDDEDGEVAEPSTSGKQIKITLKMLKDWERDLQIEDVTSGTIKTLTVAFRSALQSITAEDITEKQAAMYRVEGAAIFNGIVQLCVLHLPAALLRFLKVSSLKLAKQSKRFKKIIGPMRSYLPDITKLLENTTSTSILTVLLKHLHQLAPLMPFIFNLTKPILKRLITLWATSEDSVRVLSFLCILKITRAQQTKFLKDVLRIMYLNFVKNCKFVSPNTLPSINFMRRSLAEMFGLDMNASYNIVFMFIRQLAIHLRNAYTDRKKENAMAVYNWQYVNSLRLWGDVLALMHSEKALQPLIYPFVTIVIGVIKLIPSAQYYPVRMHCCRILVGISKRTNTFIPVLPFLLEVLKGTRFNTQHKKLSMKPLKFTCLLRLQQSQIDENAWKDEVIDQVHAQVLEYMAHESCALAFPELALFSIINLRDYLNECKNSKYHRELKQLLDKINANVTFIEKKRKTINFALKDTAQINAWETNIRNQGTPLATMFETWSKKNESKKRREASDADTLNEYSLPPLPKPKPKVVKRTRDSGSDTDENEGPTELFPSSESDSELEVEKPLKKAPQKKGNKAKALPPKKAKKEAAGTSAQVDDDAVEKSIVDIVNDLNIADWD